MIFIKKRKNEKNEKMKKREKRRPLTPIRNCGGYGYHHEVFADVDDGKITAEQQLYHSDGAEDETGQEHNLGIRCDSEMNRKTVSLQLKVEVGPGTDVDQQEYRVNERFCFFNTRPPRKSRCQTCRSESSKYVGRCRDT